MRAPAWLPIALVALLWPQPSAQALDEPLERALASVVSVLPDWPPDARRREEPEASGVAVFDGHSIVTALHAVDRARTILVRAHDGRIQQAKLTARDSATDIALLTVRTALPPIAFADAEPSLGSPVCAIGNAFGLDLTVACGVVSGMHQAGVGFNPVEDFVQTDAAVNPGASGGALVNAEGEMVGLLSAIFTKQADANIGVNFAVAAGLVEHVATQLAEHGRVRRVSSGLRLAAAPRRGATGRMAARVSAVAADSPAAAAGVSRGDLVVEAAGRPVRKPADFVSATARLTPPAELVVVVLRDGAEHRLTLEFEPDP